MKTIEYALLKNEFLIEKLKVKRQEFAGIGTNKAKRRLNKLALESPLAKSIRLALEIEDKNISAKASYGEYKNKIYKQKYKLILELSSLFQEQKWKYGIQKDQGFLTSHVIYFEIPGCKQISWHLSPEKGHNFPTYNGNWDSKENSTLDKLEELTLNLLKMYNFTEKELIDLIEKIKNGYSLADYLLLYNKKSNIDYDNIVEIDGVEVIYFPVAPPIIIGEKNEQNEDI